MPRRPLRGARAAAVLGWCSPQSSVPRQTVGHHARAAMYEMGQKAACEGCRGEVPGANPTTPPQSWGLSFSYTHRPGRSGAHGPAGSGVDFPVPQNSFVWVSLKIGSRARTQRTSLVATDQNRGQSPQTRPQARNQPSMFNARLLPARLLALPALFSYTHRPGRSGRHGPAGSGVDFPIPQNSFVWVSLKIGSRARTPQKWLGEPPRPGPTAARPRKGPSTTLGARAGPPARLPCTPSRLPYTPTGLPCTPSRLPYTPTGLPCTPSRLPYTPTGLPCLHPKSPALYPNRPTLPAPQVACPIPPLPRYPQYQATYLASNTTST
jgi:hypothetical protein